MCMQSRHILRIEIQWRTGMKSKILIKQRNKKNGVKKPVLLGMATAAGLSGGMAFAGPCGAANPCRPLGNPCSAYHSSPCAGHNPCSPCKPCHPCAGRNPCAGHNPCAAHQNCGPCHAQDHAEENPCAGANPCSAQDNEHNCHPCSPSGVYNPCAPHAGHPCAAQNPCAAHAPCAPCKAVPAKPQKEKRWWGRPE